MKFASVLLALMCSSASHAFAPSSPLSSIRMMTASSASTSEAAFLASSALKMTTDNKGPFDFLSGLFKSDDAKQVEPEKPALPDVVIDSDYNIALAFAGVGILIILLGQGSLYGIIQGGITLLFATFLAIQATRIRFVFDQTSFELKNVGGDEDGLTDSGENFVVGGENRWAYDTFVNYDFFPSRGLPILVYFKETQTAEEKWKEGPGGLDKVGGGQLHFFPAIANVDQLKEQFKLRGCAKVED